MHNSKLVISYLFILLFLCSCEEEEQYITIDSTEQIDLSDILSLDFEDYENIILPNHYLENNFPTSYPFQFAAIESDNNPINNPISNNGSFLGRVLFYEKKLSKNSTVSCASCHVQENGFSDSRIFSEGFEKGLTRRHSMSLANARFYESGKFFWDERANSLEEQVLLPFQDPVEMGMRLDELISVLENQSYAPVLFEKAFGDPEISVDRVSRALAQFIRSMVSLNAKYDQGRVLVGSPLEDFPNFTSEENLGKKIFNAQNLNAPSCNSCHMSEAFIAPLIAVNASTSATNNGLEGVTRLDQGVFETTGSPGHRGKFKVPSLRNVADRPPYMHDGRFESLEQVVEHYSSGIQSSPTLQPFLRNNDGSAIQYQFSEQEKQALVAFLKTLSDSSFLEDPKFSNPFK